MKIHLVLIIFSVATIRFACATELEDREAKQVELWKRKISEVSEMSPGEKLDSLWLGLRNMGHRKSLENHSSSVDDIYRIIQAEMLSIDGHAQHFADRIEDERALLKPNQYRGTYDSNRRHAFETLAHLPSPGTIRVLGRYLSDDRDATKVMRMDSQGMLKDMAPNSMHAVNALKNIGLREPLVVEPILGMAPKTEDFASREEAKRAWFDYLVAKREAELKPWQSWWEEVNSGKRTFSFKSQAVEYRFRPDGTWETIPIANPPDDGPKPVPVATEKEKRTSPPDTAASVEPDDRSMWWWIAGAGGLLLAVACGLFRKSRRVG